MQRLSLEFTRWEWPLVLNPSPLPQTIHPEGKMIYPHYKTSGVRMAVGRQAISFDPFPTITSCLPSSRRTFFVLA
jgi:hypothetical protein